MATFIDSLQSVFKLNDTGGALRDLSAYITAIEGLPAERELSEVAALGSAGEQFIPGLQDATFIVEGISDTIAGINPDAILGPLRTNGAVVPFYYGPKGSAAGAVRYTGNCWLYQYEVEPEVGEIARFVAEFMVHGMVTRDTFPSEQTPQVSGDDGYRDINSLETTDTRLIAGQHFNVVLWLDEYFYSFMRYVNVAIPQGATIVTAYVTFTAIQADANTCSTWFWGVAADNQAAPTTFAEFNALVNTGAGVGWTMDPWTAEATYQSPELKTIIQEIVNRPGWVSGNALIVRWGDWASPGGSQKWRRAYSYDGDPVKAALLHVEFSSP